MSTLVVLDETPHELVVWKPAGIASEARDDRDSIKGIVRRMRGVEPRLPHRLDRVTRGILLVCLSREAVAFHNAQIADRRWQKIYLARVAGDPRSCIGTHRAFLVEEDGRARIVRAGGKPAWMEIIAAERVPDRADWHLVIRLLTGRFHQIRVMCAALGLPLVGDPLYDPLSRDPNDFYLEHIVMKYERFDRTPSTIYVRDLPERGPLDPAIVTLLDELSC